MKASILLAAAFSCLVSAAPPAKTETAAQSKAPWNLHAISHRSAPARLNVFRNSDYFYTPWPEDKTLYAYVVDTGIRTTHREFEGRAENLWTAVKTADNRDNFDDESGHGTHVAGIIAAKTYGVAKKARVLSVKVFDRNGRGSTSQAISGFTFAVNDIVEKGRQNSAVINYSGGGEFSVAWNTIVERAHNRPNGPVLTITSAGNDAENAAMSSPACADKAITVASIRSDWRVAPSSNFGCRVSILAPGEKIKSLSSTSDVATKRLSGTSMAAPHVAALALNAMAVFGKSSKHVLGFLTQTATKDKVKGHLRGSPNLLANNNNDRQQP
ncbi:subtilisin-like protease PR1F, partial [Metarhizium majus ARSEF 297]